MKNIPTKEDFSKAIAADEARHQGLSEVRDRILKRFEKDGLYEAFMFYSPSNELFGVYLFYFQNSQIAAADESGLSLKIKEAVIDELENVGRGNRETIKINFEFDSHENVQANYEGDYYLRLR